MSPLSVRSFPPAQWCGEARHPTRRVYQGGSTTAWRRVGLSLLLLLALQPLTGSTAEPVRLAVEGDVSPVHDPALIREGDTWYLFATNRFEGRLLPMFCSADLRRWTLCGNVLDEVPAWALERVPGARGLWAPDVALLRGRYHLYYSVSTFGKNRSAIGLATNATLDPASPDYLWVDEGEVVASTPDDDWNAIDPNLAFDGDGAPWLSWGSFWDGIRMRRVDPATGKLSAEHPRLHALASRRPLQPPAIEAPFVVHRDGRFYLFVAFDRCCHGAESTYKVAVGRSEAITGPYRDRDGVPMLEGGGTVLLEGGESWRGPGHPAVVLGRGGGPDLLAFHAYDAATGRPRLHLSTLAWEDGWPRAARLE